MKAAVFHAAHRPLTIEDVEIDQAQAPRGAAAHRLRRPLPLRPALHGRPLPLPTPAVLGHEGAAVVEAVGEDVTYVKPGDHVITCLSVFCGECEQCTTGHTAAVRQPRGQTAPRRCTPPEMERRSPSPAFNLSCFAEQMLVHEHAIVKINSEIPLDRAALVGCGVMTGVGAVFNTAKVEAGATVAVLGCGGIGLSAINGAAIAGAERIIAIDTNSSKLDIAKQMGATHTINASNIDPVAAVKDLTEGKGVPYSFEAIGLKATAEQSFQMLRPGGVATIIGMIPFGTRSNCTAPTSCASADPGQQHGQQPLPRRHAPPARTLAPGPLKLDHLISGQIKLAEINEGFAKLKSGPRAKPDKLRRRLNRPRARSRKKLEHFHAWKCSSRAHSPKGHPDVKPSRKILPRRRPAHHPHRRRRRQTRKLRGRSQRRLGLRRLVRRLHGAAVHVSHAKQIVGVGVIAGGPCGTAPTPTLPCCRPLPPPRFAPTPPATACRSSARPISPPASPPHVTPPKPTRSIR